MTDRTAGTLARLLVLLAAATTPVACGGVDDAGTDGDAGRGAPSERASAVAADGSLPRLAAIARRGTIRDGDGGLTSVVDLSVGPDRRILVLERRTHRLKVFSPSGERLETVGESRMKEPVAMRWRPDGRRLWVVDAGLGAYLVFDRDLEYLERRFRPLGTTYRLPWTGGFDRQHRFYEVSPSENGRATMYRLRPGEGGYDPLPVPRHRRPAFELDRDKSDYRAYVPYSPELLLRLTDRGGLTAAISDDYSVARADATGDTLDVFGREGTAPEVTPAERDSAMEALSWFRELGGETDAGRIPDHKPYLRAIYRDDRGRTWLKRHRPRGARGDRFDVFGADGRFRGVVISEMETLDHPAPVIRDSTFLAVEGSRADPVIVRGRIRPAG